jgi:hypothetical protein
MTGFRPFFNPATGEWIEFTAVAEDSDGQLVRFSWRSVPGGVITEHVHPRQLAYESRLITPGAPPPGNRVGTDTAPPADSGPTLLPCLCLQA